MKIEVKSQALISDPTPQLAKLITRNAALEEDIPLLRVTNPEYLNAQKFGSKFGNKPPKWWLGYYEDSCMDEYVVPRAWIERVITEYSLHDCVEYSHTQVDVEYPTPQLTPLDHQEVALNELFSLINRNDAEGRPTDTSVVLNTSSGKTILGMLAAYHSFQRTLIVVPTKEIESGWISDAINLFGFKKSDIGQIRAGTVRIGDLFTIGSVQTLMNLEESLWADKFGMIILDELHRMSSKCFSKVLQNCSAGIRLGLTATDNRKDGLIDVVRWYLGFACYTNMTPLNCTELTYMGVQYKIPLPKNLPPKKVIETRKMKSRKEKYLKLFIKKEMLSREIEYDDDKAIKEIKKDFKQFYEDLDLPDIVRNSKESGYQLLIRKITESNSYNDFLVSLCGYIIDNYDGDILISSVSVDHINFIAPKLEQELGVPVAILTGTGSKNREKVYEEIKQGKYKITVGTQSIVSTGASNPRWSHTIIATPFSNEELAVQIKGRPIRLDKDNPNKTMGYVWDIITTSDSMAKHMGKTRFHAMSPYVQATEWLENKDVQ